MCIYINIIYTHIHEDMSLSTYMHVRPVSEPNQVFCYVKNYVERNAENLWIRPFGWETLVENTWPRPLGCHTQAENTWLGHLG